MTCREFAEFLDNYLAGTLLAEERNAFDRHLDVCEHCVAYLDSYRRTVDACRVLGGDQEEVPADVPDELVQAILASRAERE
jgi:anti-sigma factor RsiW